MVGYVVRLPPRSLRFQLLYYTQLHLSRGQDKKRILCKSEKNVATRIFKISTNSLIELRLGEIMESERKTANEPVDLHKMR